MPFPRVLMLGDLAGPEDGDGYDLDDDPFDIDPAQRAELQCRYQGGQWLGGRCVFPAPPPTDEDLLDEYVDDLTPEERAAIECAYQEGSWDPETGVCTPK